MDEKSKWSEKCLLEMGCELESVKLLDGCTLE